MSLHSFISELEDYTTIPLEKQILFEKRKVILNESKIKRYNNSRIIEIEKEMSCQEIEWLNDLEMDNAIILAYLKEKNENELINLCFKKSKEKKLFLLRALRIANDCPLEWMNFAISAIENDAHLDVLITIVRKYRERLYRNNLFLILIKFAVHSKEHLSFLINDLKLFLFENQIFTNADKFIWMMSKSKIHDRISDIYEKLFFLVDEDVIISRLDIINPVFITYISNSFPIRKLIASDRVEIIRKIVEDLIPDDRSFVKKINKFISFFKMKGVFDEEEEALRKMFSLKRICKEKHNVY